MERCKAKRTDEIDLVCQTIGGAFSVASAQVAFVNQMLVKLAETAPGVDAARLIATGASALRTGFTPEELPGIILAYMHGLKAAFAVSIGFCGLAFLATLTVPWRRLKTHLPEEKQDGVSA